ncbi:p115 like vesicle tethering protein [Podospora didyma]|uniref:P115 like vesicle tethering protein n=1 Tax=Podospora didyma TaxID=330526 RepID=A0AAE0U107_9PEZI|nr:p115 like vesicle tethering protein [Podospora didyma]
MFSTITTAPAKQSVSETIAVLSNRLSTATLLEDRRGAIMGLRSFAKQYPASVASGALRSLIGSLSKDGEDVDTVKAVMETLLWLFRPSEDSPEASEEIALWLADEFTQRQENISLLLDFLDTNDYSSRLYSLQLLGAILSARTERTEQCVLTADMGVPRLVTVLDDRREPIRNEAINLLTDLTPMNISMQQLVAYEKGFDRIFGIIASEGGLSEGGRVVEDCLILLANLLRLNSVNQTMFREMRFIPQLGRLLESAYKRHGGDQDDDAAPWVEAQRNRNIYALLAVIRLFLVAGAVGTPQNQAAFLGERVLENTLQLAFAHGAELPIKSEALVTCADMIRGNARLQEKFAGLQVPAPFDALVNGQGTHINGGVPKVYVIDGLLDLILAVNAPQAFDLRMAASSCLRAYFFGHAEIRRHFLTRAIEGHKLNGNELTNVLTTLLHPHPEPVASDPYRYWFASVLMLHLIHENPATKALAMSVTEGDEASGEEVVTSIQTIAAHLLSSVAKSEDPRVIIGYLMLLLCWLFEDLDGVNDFLGEFTNLQGLIQAAVENPNGDVIVQGLSAMLAGVIYEFSTKDSPVSRATVREMILSRMGRDRYVDKMSKLRSHPLMRDHEVLSQSMEAGPDQKLPDVYLDDTFVEFFKDNYRRILRAIDRDPGLEISVITNGVQKGISRELVDSLRAQVDEKERALQNAAEEKQSLARQLKQEQTNHQGEISRAKAVTDGLRAQLAAKERAVQSGEGAAEALKRQLAQEQTEHQRAKAEISRLKAVNDGLQRNHEEESRKTRAEQKLREEQLQKQVETIRKTAETETDRARRLTEAAKADLKATISRLEVDLMKANKAKSVAESRVTELEAKLDEAKSVAESRTRELEAKLKSLTETLGGVEKRLKESDEGVRKMSQQFEQKEEERKATQNELDDLLIVFSDLEDKVTKYRDRLKSLGETVSDGEDDDEEEAGDDDEE